MIRLSRRMKQKLAKIARQFDLKFVILHGSYATGHVRKGSDLDLAVIGHRPFTFKKLIALQGNLGDLFGNSQRRELDVKSLDRVDPFFRYEVTRDSVLLYGDAADYEDFKAYAQRAYEDARPLLDLEHTLSERYQIHLNAFTHAHSQS